LFNDTDDVLFAQPRRTMRVARYTISVYHGFAIASTKNVDPSCSA
jgi:hypothetical protein